MEAKRESSAVPACCELQSILGITQLFEEDSPERMPSPSELVSRLLGLTTEQQKWAFAIDLDRSSQPPSFEPTRQKAQHLVARLFDTMLVGSTVDLDKFRKVSNFHDGPLAKKLRAISQGLPADKNFSTLLTLVPVGESSLAWGDAVSLLSASRDQLQNQLRVWGKSPDPKTTNADLRAQIIEVLADPVKLKDAEAIAAKAATSAVVVKAVSQEVIKCAKCDKEVPTKQKCSRCKQVYYCDATCQKQHWSVHKRVCRKPSA